MSKSFISTFLDDAVFIGVCKVTPLIWSENLLPWQETHAFQHSTRHVFLELFFFYGIGRKQDFQGKWLLPKSAKHRTERDIIEMAGTN